MMKRSVVSLAMLALVATSAYGSSVVMLPTIGTQTGATTGSFSYSISEDGRYVGGRVTDTDGLYSPAIYNLATSSWSVVPPTSGSVTGSGNVPGVAHRATSSMVYAGVNQADNGTRPATYTTTNQFGRGYKGGTVYGLSPGSETMVASCSESSSGGYSGGGAASFADGSDAWLAANHSQGGTSRGNESYLYKASDGGTAWATLTSGRASTKFATNGVASTGRVVGWDGASATRAGAYWDGGAGGTFASTSVVEIAHVPEIKPATAWFAYGISNSGQYAVGYQPITTVSRIQAFRADNTTGTAVVLNTASGAPNANEQAVAYDIADDGTAVGYDYQSGRVTGSGTYESCIWFPTATTFGATTFNANQAYGLVAVATAAGANLSGWTHLGFGASSITKVGGSYIISGNGNYGGANRAFVLTIPEPATLAFLALGGLAMLRRRR